MRILLTGALGFMGQHLHQKLLNLGHQVVPMDKKLGNSTSENLFPDGKFDFIVHLGANCSSQISLREPSVDFTDNAIGTFNVCEFSRNNGNIPIIFNSTMKVYPGEDGIIPPYGTSKLVGEMYLKMYQKVYGMPYVINRPSSVYGPLQDGSDDGGWVTWFIKASLTDKTINLYGDGTQSRDILYIDDCINMIVDQILNFKKYQNKELDWGGGESNELSLNQLLNILGYHNVAYKEKLKGDVQRFVVDNTGASRINDWRPLTTVSEGIDKTIKWFKNNL